MTSATERIRALLDERGVEWWQKKRHTCWKVSKGQEVEMWRAWEAPDGSLTLKVDYIYDLTPEQAIAATLGRSNVGRYVGLRHGEYWERTENGDYYCGGCGWKVTDHDSYCPECGGALHKIVEPTTNDVDAEVGA